MNPLHSPPSLLRWAKERLKRSGRGERRAERLAGVESSPALTGKAQSKRKEKI